MWPVSLGLEDFRCAYRFFFLLRYSSFPLAEVARATGPHRALLARHLQMFKDTVIVENVLRIVNEMDDDELDRRPPRRPRNSSLNS